MTLLNCRAFVLVAYGLAAIAQDTPTVQLKVVRGMPFTARVVTESIQTLADGNRIVHKTEAFIARDSQGRTRREQGSIVFIHDAVTGMAYVLDTKATSARRIALQKHEGPEPAAGSSNESEPLGSQFIEGFRAEGTRVRKKIPAGIVGNERTLEVFSESWHSPELQTMVMKRTADPRFGETSYKLTEIQPGEPAPSLFAIPNDYTVREESQPSNRVLK